MKMGNLFASSAIAVVMGLGLGALPTTIAQADVEATTAIGQPEELIGKNVKDDQGNTVGEIDSVLIDQEGKVRYVIVGVGGFLGIGEQNVAMRWDSLRINADGSEIVAPVTKDALSKLPPYKYGDVADSGKVYPLERGVEANPYLADNNATGDVATDANTGAAVTAGAGDVDAEALIGKNIVNANGETVGEIKSVVIDQGGAVKYVIAGVGGFLGVGERDVAMKWDDLTIDGQGARVTAPVTKEQLLALPEYRQPENISTGGVYSYDDAVRSNQYLAEGGVAQTPTDTQAQGGTQTQAQTQGQAQTQDQAPAATAGTDIDNDTTVTIPGLRTSDVVGAKVENPTGENVGEISEVILEQDGRVNGVVVDVGGFLGVGERPVLLKWQDLQFTGTEGDLAVSTSLDKDQLTTFPEYRSNR